MFSLKCLDYSGLLTDSYDIDNVPVLNTLKFHEYNPICFMA